MKWSHIGCVSEWFVFRGVRQGIEFLDFAQSSDGYSSVVKVSGARIRSSLRHESPGKVGLDCSFGRPLYV